MQKSILVDEINAFAAARASGNLALTQRQAQVLDALIAKLPDELPEKEEEKPVEK